MKINIIIIFLIITSIILNIINYHIFLITLSITWYIATVMIIYSAIKYTIQYKLIQLSIKNIIIAIKSKSKNNISPLSSLCLSLAAKVGVGSLSGIALSIYYGGVGTIFWIIIISLLVTINTYIESIIGIKYRTKIKNNYLGGPSYYIKKCLGNKTLSILYSFILIITYSILFLSIQTNTIITTTNTLNINKTYMIIILLIITLLIIIKGIKLITKINLFLVPLMIVLYLIIGIYIFLNNLNIISNIILNIIKEALNIKSIHP